MFPCKVLICSNTSVLTYYILKKYQIYQHSSYFLKCTTWEGVWLQSGCHVYNCFHASIWFSSSNLKLCLSEASQASSLIALINSQHPAPFPVIKTLQ